MMIRIERAVMVVCLVLSAWCLGIRPADFMAHAAMLDQILAVVNDEVITQRDFDEMFLPLQEQLSEHYSGDELEARLAKAEKDLLDSLIEDRLVLSEAKRIGVTVSEEDVEERLKDIRSQFESEKQFEMVMAAQGLTPERLRKVYHNQLMSKRAVDYMVYSRIVIPPSDVAAYYESHRDEFRQPDQMHVSNILIRAGEQEDRAETRRRAEEIYRRLLNGESFAELARQHSKGPAAEEGGDLGTISLANIRPELAVALRQVDGGDLTPVIESELGYHIFLVHEKTTGAELSLEQAQEAIKRRLLKERFTERLQEWLAELRQKAYIEVRANTG